MSSTNYAISIIVILILGLIVKEAAIQDSIKIILCIIVGIVAYIALNTRYSEKFATTTKKWITVQMINDMIDTKIAALPSSSSSSAGAMTYDQVNTMIRDKMGTISASPSASSSSLTSGQLDNLAKLTVLSDLKTSELNNLAQLAETPPVGLTPAQTTTLTTLGALSGLSAAQTTSLTTLSGLTAAQITTLMGLVAPPVTVAGVATTSVKLPDNVAPGTIVIWYGSLASIPPDWALCDGADGTRTPDLRGRFVLCQGQSEIGKFENRNLNSKGGKEKIYLTQRQIPDHTHNSENTTLNTTTNCLTTGGCSTVMGQSLSHTTPGYVCNECSKGKTFQKEDDNGGKYDYYDATPGAADTGGVITGEKVDIMPPFYVLAYIMKKFPERAY